MPSVLITGANKGIGLAFAQSFAVDGWKVHACCRQPDKAKGLQGIEGDISIHKLDVTDGLRVASVARGMLDEKIDILINNAGYYGPRLGFGEIDYEDWAHTFQVNTMAPLRMVENFIEHVAGSERKLIVNVSSKMGSVAENEGGGAYVYRSSKAALNVVTKSLAVDLKEQGVTVICVHPGHVQTDMGGEQAPLTISKSVSGLRKLIGKVTHEQTGQFFNYDGTIIPW
ncbi:short-chain dehydrogenase [Kiloniella litopenaei]|uniref:Short-chain dehydrogenase n=1 Tax=Kiloniella litopenaei TaxID=1549748 RepID=A0A0M2R8Q3_9PROT|nr:SDR family oxidoreductase [Kiloniella litopenaei]KKJ76829.1 short-chain dehydrogenase [Kiloniella litopenaei]